MGRTIRFYDVQLFDDEELEDYEIDMKTIERLEKKYKESFCWKLSNERIQFKEDPVLGVLGEPSTHIKMLLEINKKYDRNITGTFMYSDNQSGGSYNAVVYIFKHIAYINQFNTDGVKLKDLAKAIECIHVRL